MLDASGSHSKPSYLDFWTFFVSLFYFHPLCCFNQWKADVYSNSSALVPPISQLVWKIYVIWLPILSPTPSAGSD